MTTLSDEALIAKWDAIAPLPYIDELAGVELTRLLALARRGAETKPASLWRRAHEGHLYDGDFVLAWRPDGIAIAVYSPNGWYMTSGSAVMQIQEPAYHIPLSALGNPEEL